jgi:hypothetical protein
VSQAESQRVQTIQEAKSLQPGINVESQENGGIIKFVPYVTCLGEIGAYWNRTLVVGAIFLQNKDIREIIYVIFGREQGRHILSQIVRVAITSCWEINFSELHAEVSLRSGCSVGQRTQ